MSRFDRLPPHLKGLEHIVADAIAPMCSGTDATIESFSQLPVIAPPFEEFVVSYCSPKIANGAVVVLHFRAARPSDFGGCVLAATVTVDGAVGLAVGLAVGPTGEPIRIYPQGGPEDGWFHWIGYVPHSSSVPEGRASRQSDLPLLLPALLAISLMHCSNVRQEVVFPPRKLAKKHERKHGKALQPYRVLHIQPMRRILETEGGLATNGLAKAMHLCRAHFRKFPIRRDGTRSDTGSRVFVPAHVRGSVGDEPVPKTYAVTP